MEGSDADKGCTYSFLVMDACRREGLGYLVEVQAFECVTEFLGWAGEAVCDGLVAPPAVFVLESAGAPGLVEVFGVQAAERMNVDPMVRRIAWGSHRETVVDGDETKALGSLLVPLKPVEEVAAMTVFVAEHEVKEVESMKIRASSQVLGLNPLGKVVEICTLHRASSLSPLLVATILGAS